MRKLGLFNILILLLTVFLSHNAYSQSARDRYVGYYYPAPQQVELYCSRVAPLPDVTRVRRTGFIIGIKNGMSKQPYEPPYAVFAKGAVSTKLIIISKQDGYLNTIYRARALLADLSTSARTTPIFAKSGVADKLTFLDLVSMLGFQSVTMSDGDSFAHQIVLLPASNARCQPVQKKLDTK